jgi:hypothetical protein
MKHDPESRGTGFARLDLKRGLTMDAQELRKIEQRLAEGYYDADAEALRTMKSLIAELRRFREEEALREPEVLA